MSGLRSAHAARVTAMLLSLACMAGCARHRNRTSPDLMPTQPSHNNTAVSGTRDSATRAEDKIDSVLKQLENTGRSSTSSRGDTERPVAQIGTGSGRVTTTTGTVPPRSSSSGWSSVVSEASGSNPRAPTSSSGSAASGAIPEEHAWDGTKLSATIVACCLVAAILWLPRWLEERPQPR